MAKIKIKKNDPFCHRCGVPLTRENRYRGSPRLNLPGAIWCRDCWPYAARGFFDLRLPDWWLGKGRGLIKLQPRKPRPTPPEDTPKRA